MDEIFWRGPICPFQASDPKNIVDPHCPYLQEKRLLSSKKNLLLPTGHNSRLSVGEVPTPSTPSHLVKKHQDKTRCEERRYSRERNWSRIFVLQSWLDNIYCIFHSLLLLLFLLSWYTYKVMIPWATGCYFKWGGQKIKTFPN